MGFLTPFTTRVKCLSQDMWQRGVSWDQELPEIVINGWYGTDKIQNGPSQVLYVFSDASERETTAQQHIYKDNQLREKLREELREEL